MTKPRGVRWLEEQTGQPLNRHAQIEGKHLSLRIPGDLAERLAHYAGQRNHTVSEAARRLLSEGLERAEHPDAEAIDAAIALLEGVRSDLILDQVGHRGGGRREVSDTTQNVPSDSDSR